VAATFEELDIPTSQLLTISYTGPVLPDGLEKHPHSEPVSAPRRPRQPLLRWVWQRVSVEG